MLLKRGAFSDVGSPKMGVISCENAIVMPEFGIFMLNLS